MSNNQHVLYTSYSRGLLSPIRQLVRSADANLYQVYSRLVSDYVLCSLCAVKPSAPLYTRIL